MKELSREYTTLFNAITDAVEQLSQCQPDEKLFKIKIGLITAQQKAEELYMSRSKE